MMQKQVNRILLLEDNLAEVDLLYEMLDEAAAGQFHIQHVSRLRDAITALALGATDFILSDLHLPDTEGLPTLLALRRAAPQLPIIVFSSMRDEQLAIQAVHAGAQDYLVKGQFDGNLLVRAIRYAIERRQLEDDKQHALDDLEIRVQQRTAELEAANRSLQNEVAERKHAEDSLRQSENLLFQYLEAMPVGIAVVDTAGHPYFTNRAAKRLFGKGPLLDIPAAQVAQTFGLYQTGTDQLYPHEQGPTSRALAGERSTIYDMEIRKRERVIPLEVSGAPIYDEQGNVALAITTFHDISERRTSEAQLRESEQRFRAVFENGLEAMLLLDDAGTIIEANGPASVLFDRPGAELPGQALSDLVNPVDGGVIMEMWRELRQKGELSGEYKYKYENGATGDFEFTGKADFMPHYHLVLIRDVTARNRAEEDRTARDAAEQANRAKSQFLSNMSHELRTPLNSILGFAQLLTLDELTPEQDENVEFILKAGRHLIALITEVLDIARIESGGLSISPEPVLLQEVINESIDLVTPMAAQRNIELRADGIAQLGNGHVMADRQRLIQVLLNLLSNAIKYNREGGAVLISCAPGANGRLRVLIRDNGAGISAEKQRLLFTPFERLGAEHSTIEGTGLGLALSRALIEALGGAIGVESAPGQGSTFWIELAITRTPDESVKRKGTGELIFPADPNKIRTVLYIEDNPASLQLVTRIMVQQPGIKLLSSHSGLGIELARDNDINLILLDIHLPDINGDEALRRLKADPKTSAIPVIVLSADATPKQLNNMMAAGAYAYLTKPLDIKQFLRMLKELFKD